MWQCLQVRRAPRRIMVGDCLRGLGPASPQTEHVPLPAKLPACQLCWRESPRTAISTVTVAGLAACPDLKGPAPIQCSKGSKRAGLRIGAAGAGNGRRHAEKRESNVFVESDGVQCGSRCALQLVPLCQSEVGCQPAGQARGPLGEVARSGRPCQALGLDHGRRALRANVEGAEGGG